MTVSELINKLKLFESTELVIVNGYEGGFSDVGDVSEIKIDLNVNSEDFLGPHEESDSGKTKAVAIGRKGR